MKSSITLAFFLLSTILGTAQSFQEICGSSNANGTVVDYMAFGDSIYATGFFNNICDHSVGYIAKWENNEWLPSAINITDPGHAFEVINDQLYIAKYEESIDSNWVYFYNNSTLEKLGAGVYLTTASGYSELPNIYDIKEFNGNIVACGEFDRVGQQSVSGIMQWNGTDWQPLGQGLSGNIISSGPVMFPHEMFVYQDELYVVGNFTNAGSEVVNGIAKWNGTNWTAMGNGFNGTVYSITVFNNEIIVGGSFTESGGTPINRIAKWNGTAWVSLDFGFTSTSQNDFIFVHTLKVIDDILYIGGGLKEITYADNSTEVCNGIISYSGNNINTFDGGVVGNDIEAIIKTENDQLLIGGGVFGNGYTGIVDINSSVQSVEFTTDVQIYPNPFEQLINITATDHFDKYVLLDAQGKIYNTGKYENILSFNVPSGVYIIKLMNDDFQSIQRIIKL